MRSYFKNCGQISPTSRDVALRATSWLAPAEGLWGACGPILGSLRDPISYPDFMISLLCVKATCVQNFSLISFQIKKLKIGGRGHGPFTIHVYQSTHLCVSNMCKKFQLYISSNKKVLKKGGPLIGFWSPQNGPF